MKTFFCVVGILCCFYAGGQTCNYFPADCPQTGDIETAQDSNVSITNLVVAQEITMQNILRDNINAMMQEIASKKSWKLFEYSEETGGGIGGDGKPTPYSLRKPHQFMISFVFIVNEDSLRAWQEWYNIDLQNASNKVVESYQQAGTDISHDDNRQKNLDSAMYYGDQKTKYANDHAADYQKAILSNDTKTQKKYENNMKKFDDKINGFINNTNGATEKKFASSKSQADNLADYRHKSMIAFRSGSMIRITINVNDYIVAADDDDGNKKIVKQLSIPAGTFGLLMHNNSPTENEVFGQYLRCPDVGMVLYGKWILKQDQYHGYHAVYSLDKKNTDAITIKKVPCDKVQTLVLHVEGSTNYINQFFQVYDSQKMNALIVKE